jgi:hypothetical protein
MQTRERRLLMMAVIVVLGSVLVLFDIPPVMLIAGTVVAGVVVMVASGALALSELKPSNWRKKSAEKKQQSPAPAPKKAEKTKRFSGLAQFAGSLRAGIRRFTTKEKDTSTHIKKLDEQLDRALDESPVKVPASTPKAPAPGGGGGGVSVDPFMALSNAKLEEDLVIDPNLDMNFDLDQSTNSDQNLETKPAEAIASIEDAAKLDLALDEEKNGESQIDADDADEVAAILKSNEEGSGDLGEVGGLTDLNGSLDAGLDSLGEMDLGAIDLDKEMGLDANAPGSAPAAATGTAAPSPKIKEVAASAPAIEAPPVMASNQNDMAAFASGSSGGGDDLMAALKADAGSVQQKRDLSLLRDMKDYRTNAGDLALELEEAVSILKSKK